MMNLDQVIAVRADKTVYRDGENIIKLFNNNYSKTDVLNEALNQARVEDIGLNIPKIKEVSMVDGKWAIISEYIKGVTLETLMKENPGDFDKLLNDFVELQLQVQSKSCMQLARLKDKMNYKISIADVDASLRYDLHTRLESMPKNNKVCHGDFNPSNIILGEDGKYYILDWSHVTRGNGSADAARTYLLFRLAGDIDTADQYLKLFCEKSDISIKYVQSWMPIVAASQSTKCKPEEREFLLNWANVVDYE